MKGEHLTSLFSPKTDTIQRSLAPETFRQTLHMTQSETAWTFLHAGTAGNQVEFPSPASSEYHLPLSRRPKSAGISHLTARENKRLEDRSELVVLLSPNRAAGNVMNPAVRTPTDKDFQRIMDRLQKLQAGNIGNRRIVLTEDKSEEVMLENEETQYFKVTTLGKSCPLKVTVQRAKGSLVIYMSRTLSEPSELLSDAVYKKDTFAISDPGLRFKTEQFFFAAKGLNPVIFTIHIKFGKRGSSRSDSSLKNRQDMKPTEEEVRWEAFQKEYKPKTPQYGVDYMKRNLFILPPTSPKRKKELKIRKKTAEERRQAVLLRKQSILSEKKQRTYLVLHRHELRVQAQQKAQEILALIERKESFEKSWILLMWNAKFSEVLHAKMLQRKEAIAVNRKRVHAAVWIQIHFRRAVKRLDGLGLALKTPGSIIPGKSAAEPRQSDERQSQELHCAAGDGKTDAER